MATDDERADIFERAEPTGNAISREEILGRRDASRMRRSDHDAPPVVDLADGSRVVGESVDFHGRPVKRKASDA